MSEFQSRTIAPSLLDNISSVVAKDATFTGDFSSSSPDAGLRLQGTLNGGIRFSAGGIVHIAPSAKVIDGVIEADYVLIEGVFSGQVHARKAVEIAVTAIVTGSVKYDGELDICKNARIRASIEYTGNMGEQEQAAEAPTQIQGQAEHDGVPASSYLQVVSSQAADPAGEIESSDETLHTTMDSASAHTPKFATYA